MNENELTGISRLEEAFRRHDRLYLKKYPAWIGMIPCHQKKQRILYKRVLTAVLTIVMLFGGMFGIYAAKDVISDFAVRVYEGFIEIFFEKEEIMDHIEQDYSLSVLPQGYQLLEEHISEYEIKRLWQNENGELIVLTQLPLDTKSTIDREDLIYKSIDMDGLTVLYTEKHDKRCLYWQTEQYVFSLIVPIGFSEKDCISFIGTLKINE